MQNGVGQFAAAVEVAGKLESGSPLGPALAFSVGLDAAHELLVVAADDGDGVIAAQVEGGMPHAVFVQKLQLWQKNHN